MEATSDVFDVSFAGDILKLIRNLREGGFYKVWDNWSVLLQDVLFNFKYRNDTLSGVRRRSDYITFTNLSSFMIVCMYRNEYCIIRGRERVHVIEIGGV